MAKKSDNYFVKVAKYQKEHPRATRDHAMKMVSKECKSVSGKKKTTVKRKASAPKKKSIIKTERITTIGSKKRKSGPIGKAVNISKKINDLETVLKNTTGTTAKNHIKRLINAEHDKLDQVTKNLKSA